MNRESDSNFESLRAIESLRAGVPNAAAVRLLGTDQTEILDAFSRAIEGSAVGTQEGGFIIEGGFGRGKSHLLATMQQMALERNWACSIVSVSKEMTLSAISAVYAAAIREMRLPGKSVGGSCAEFLDQLDTGTSRFAETIAYLTSENCDMDPVFGATLQVYDLYRGDIASADVLDDIIDFWDGDRCKAAELRHQLRAVNQEYKHIRQPSDTSLGLQRFEFAATLLQCAGYNGWILFVDEAELVAKFPLFTRAKCYATLASLLKCPGFIHASGVLSIVAVTDDFRYEVFQNRRDRDNVSRFSGRYADLGQAAVTAIDFIERDVSRYSIGFPEAQETSRIARTVLTTYKNAYPDFAGELMLAPVDNAATMRTNIKHWITEMDLKRTYPHEALSMRISSMEYDLGEEPEETDTAEDS